jgi:hypothetical protein
MFVTCSSINTVLEIISIVGCCRIRLLLINYSKHVYWIFITVLVVQKSVYVLWQEVLIYLHQLPVSLQLCGPVECRQVNVCAVGWPEMHSRMCGRELDRGQL